LVIGLGTSIKNRIGQASRFDKFTLFGPLSSAIAMAIFGSDHLVAANDKPTVANDKPTVSGFTTGWSCARALLNAATTKRIRTKHSLRDFCTTFSCSPVLHYCQISLPKEPVGSGRVLGLHDLGRPIAHGIGNAKSDGMGLIIVVPTSQSLIAEENFFR